MKKIAILIMGILMITAFSQGAIAQRSVRKKVVTTKKVVRVPRAKVIYKRPTTKVVSVRTLPSNRTVINHKGLSYTYVNNKFFRYYGGHYLPVAPAVGLRIGTLPIGYSRIVVGARNYFYYDGIYYRAADDDYEVVRPEIGAIIYELPEDYEKVEVDGAILYESDNVLYEKIHVDGTRAYEVVGIVE
ncbi:hypothetical protein SAMN05421636_104470 [Pricia antarctica]|uniref:Orphan protein n=1 Tax=Pricia antarctica TaxID=641691 RepID=A0A1G7CB03_9FLAO|nr:DUF6515 family protein [Pricia antarctica]SDE35900.1 hypothetical protein SAMN05421636_104470 [Pricia antarctica]